MPHLTFKKFFCKIEPVGKEKVKQKKVKGLLVYLYNYILYNIYGTALFFYLTRIFKNLGQNLIIPLL